MKSLSRVQLLVTPWTTAYQAPPSMGFSRQEYWRGCHHASGILRLRSIKLLGTMNIRVRKLGRDLKLQKCQMRMKVKEQLEATEMPNDNLSQTLDLF